jgi:hypothetical protein
MIYQFLFVLLFSLPSIAQAQDEKITPCAIKNGRAMAKELNEKPLKDKVKHCTLTCVVTQECSQYSARSLGYIKEILDLMGMGQADWDDISANELGIQLAVTEKAQNKLECYQQCQLNYP